MVDPWPASARLWRTPWSSPEEEGPSGAAPDAPIGLEAWRPPEPPQYGITYEAPKPEPYEEFAKSWLAPVRSESNQTAFEIQPYLGWLDQPGQEQRLSADSVLPADDRTPADSRIREVRPSPWGAFVMPGIGGAAAGGAAAAGAGTSAAGVGASVASAAGEFALPAAAHVGRAAVAGTASAVAAPAVVAGAVLTPTNSQNRSIDLGDGRRLVWPSGTLSFELQKSDGGIFNSGLLQSWKPTDGSVRDELQSHPKLSLDNVRNAFGEDGAALARSISKAGKESAPETRSPLLSGEQRSDRAENGASVAEKIAEAHRVDDVSAARNGQSTRDDYFSRKILREYPGLIQMDADTFSANGMEATEGEKEHEETCKEVTKLFGQPAPDSRYLGEDGRDSPVGMKTSPKVGASAASTRPADTRHENGLIGENEMINRIHNVRPSEHVPYWGNPPGVNGPDGITVSDGHRRVMTLESKYSTDPRAVPPSYLDLSPGNPVHVLNRLGNARRDGRVPRDVLDEAIDKYTDGNFSKCTTGTGNAHNGYIVHYRNREPVYVRRIRK